MRDRTESSLQHPRRSLGNRHRAQAERFLRLAESEETGSSENLLWAEQSARQAVLHDFTNQANWRLLVDLKVRRADENGIHAVMEDLFSVLGRPQDGLESLKHADLLEHGLALLDAAFDIDPLEPDTWWQTLNSEQATEAFTTRMLALDLRDPRANTLFGRRIERFRTAGSEDRFIQLSTHLLSHRPSNHEAWTELGRLHERRGEFDDAWLCYDQAQTHFASLQVRDEFRDRMIASMDSSGGRWSAPDMNRRVDFLERMEQFARRRVDVVEGSDPSEDPEEEAGFDAQRELQGLLSDGQVQAAFFLARRLVTNGETWAEEYLAKAKQALD